MKFDSWKFFKHVIILGLIVFCVQYATAYHTKPGQVQLVQMAGLEGDPNGEGLHALYTVLLGLAVVGLMNTRQKNYACLKKINISTNVLIIIMTATPLYLSRSNEISASFYEYYLGEALTIAICLAAITIIAMNKAHTPIKTFI